jgi:glycerol-3-phosphate dehydrogenase
MKNIAIIGSGSWGVALAIHLAKLGNNIKIMDLKELCVILFCRCETRSVSCLE